MFQIIQLLQKYIQLLQKYITVYASLSITEFVHMLSSLIHIFKMAVFPEMLKMGKNQNKHKNDLNLSHI